MPLLPITNDNQGSKTQSTSFIHPREKRTHWRRHLISGKLTVPLAGLSRFMGESPIKVDDGRHAFAWNDDLQ
jgi:hypothetical protein